MPVSPEPVACAESVEAALDRLRELAALPDEELARTDIAEINLRAAAGLPETESIDVAACLQRLDEWAKLVEQGTRRMLPKFYAAPEQYERCEAKFRMLVLVTVLRRNLGLTYNLAFSTGDYDASDARNLFLHGLLNGWGGTCPTFPALYVAIGRRLGYPLWLVPTLGHVFCRWDDPSGTRFNIEATSPGFAPLDDDHFRGRPQPITDLQIRVHGFLRSMTPRRELASFLYSRATCLLHNMLFWPSVPVFRLAAELAPDVEYYRRHLLASALMCRLSQVADDLRRRCTNTQFASLGVEGIIERASLALQPAAPWEREVMPSAKELYAHVMRNALRRRAEQARPEAINQFTTSIIA